MVYLDRELCNKCINYKWKFNTISKILLDLSDEDIARSNHLWIKDYYKKITEVIEVSYYTSCNIF